MTGGVEALQLWVDVDFQIIQDELSNFGEVAGGNTLKQFFGIRSSRFIRKNLTFIL